MTGQGHPGGIKSKCITGKSPEGWSGGNRGWEKREKEVGGFKPGRVVPLEMGLPLGPATLSKDLQL